MACVGCNCGADAAERRVAPGWDGAANAAETMDPMGVGAGRGKSRRGLNAIVVVTVGGGGMMAWTCPRMRWTVGRAAS